jgi:hypothetical protein
MFWTRWKKEKSLAMLGIEPLFFDCPAPNLVTIPAGLSWLSFNVVSTVDEVHLIKRACVQVSFLCLLITLTKLILKSSLFWDVTQCRLVVSSPTFRDNLLVPPLSIRQSLLLDP